MFISHELKKFRHEVEEELSMQSINEWIAYFQYKNEMETKEHEKYKRQSHTEKIGSF